MAGCISLFVQLFLHLLSTYTNLPHLPSLNQSFSRFLQIAYSISCSVDPVYVSIYFMYHCLLLKHFTQVVSKHNHTTPFALPSLAAASFNLNMSFSSSVFLSFINFTQHIALTINLSAFLKIAISFFSNTTFCFHITKLIFHIVAFIYLSFHPQ